MIKCQHQFSIKVVMEAVNRLIIEIFIVKLGMIMGLHKLSIAKLIYRGWNTCNGNGKIIGPGLDGEVDFQAFRVCLFRRLDMFGCLLHKGSVFIGTADCILLSMGMGRKLEVKVCDHLSLPLRMGGKYLFVGTGGPVIFGVYHTPLFCCHSTEYKSFSWLISHIDKGPCNSKHHGNSCVIILETSKIRVIMGRQHDHLLRLFSRDHTGNVIRLPVTDHCRLGIK